MVFEGEGDEKMIIEGRNFLFDLLKTAVYPYPELVIAEWPHAAIAIYMVIHYFVCLVVLHLAYQEWNIKEAG